LFFKKYLTILILLVSLFFALPRGASAVDWFPIVPCGLNQQPANATRMDTLPDGTQVPHDYTQPCNQCLLIELGKNVIDFTFYGIVPSVGTLMFLVAGFIILFNARSGNSSGVTKGRQIMKDTAIGIAIILGAWLITNFILRSLANDQIANTPWYQIQCTVGTLKNIVDGTTPPPPGTTVQKYSCNSSNRCVLDPNGQDTSNVCSGNCQAPPGGVLAISTASLSDAIQNTAYTQSLSATGGATPYTWTLSSGTLPAGLSLSGSNISGTPTATGTVTFTVKVEDSASPKQSATKSLTINVSTTTTGGVQCLQSGLNLCQGNAPQGCANASCAQYGAMASRQATGVATANVLKAFMEAESSCDISLTGGNSYGLMQLTPPIPQIYASRCGVSANIINQAWLTSPANAELSICIAAQWINAVSASRCGSSIRNLYAGYNGGTGQNGACGLSVSCAGQTSCSGEPMKRWECLYEDTAHTQCNGATAAKPQGDILKGYNPTRNAATRIQYCVTNPGF